MRRVLGTGIVLCLALAGTAGTAGAVPALPASADGGAATALTTPATYEGRTIDLASDWEGAVACLVADEGTTCFSSRAAFERALAVAEARAMLDPDLSLHCSGSAVFYEHTYQGGRSVGFTQRQVSHDLANYSMSSKVSSYQIGPCSAVLTDANGTVYPGTTAAYTRANSMQSGWDNRVRRVSLA
jgi:hypothetical protein